MDDELVQRRLLKLAALRFGDCALNLGRGVGSLTIALADAVPGVVIATIDSDGRKERPNVLLFRSSSHALPFAGAQFNVVVATFQLLQTNDPGVLSVLREAARVLLPRGKFVASNWEGPAQRAVAGRSQALRNLVCDAGFERLRDDGRLMTSAGIVHCLHARVPRHK